MCLKLIPRGIPLKRGGIKGVRGHTWNQPNGSPGRAGGVRKKSLLKVKTKNCVQHEGLIKLQFKKSQSFKDFYTTGQIYKRVLKHESNVLA